MKKQHGFTLVELIVTVAVAAILMAIAMPSLRSSMTRSQVSTAANDFSATLQFARAQAVSLNRCVSVCSSQNTLNMAATSPTVPSCTGSGVNWDTGWIVFEDAQCGTSAPAALTDILKVQHPQKNGVTINAQALNRVTFDGRGTTGFVVPERFQISPIEGSSNQNARNLCLSGSGRVQIRDVASSGCPAGS
jgi:type IV fimbrial biogenesis protein FimT